MKNVKISDLNRVYDYASRYNISKHGHLSPLRFIIMQWEHDAPMSKRGEELDAYIEKLWSIILGVQIIDPEMEQE